MGKILFIWVCFALFSYSQIDLNLTLSTDPTYQRFQETMIKLGYFERPTSTAIYLSLLALLTISFVFFIRKFAKNSKSQIRALFPVIFLIYSVAVFAYPAFSHDIYNYMFDARIVSKHHLSPYDFRALDFPDDTWTRFMRWTHRYYPYGPSWLWLTLIPSYLGGEKFLATLFLFKIMFFLAALGNCYLTYVIAKKIGAMNPDFIALFFSLNPLVIIESIISPHNEVFLLFFMLLSLYLFFTRQKLLSFLSLLLSIGIKFLSVVLLPLYIGDFLKRKKFTPKQILGMTLVLYLVALVPVILARELYPWYFIPVFALASFFANKPIFFWTSLGLSVGTLARYAPFLYFGNFDAPVSMISNWTSFLFLIAGMMVGGIANIKYQKSNIKNTK